MNNYDHSKIEKKWQKIWSETGLYVTKAPKDKKSYILDMFPYPSGDGLHVGHPKGYIATDVLSRYRSMQGISVLHPMGWDAFGLPAENYAINNKVHPAIAVKRNIKRFKKQLEALGFSYDWKREINTTDPNYYKWTQWIFLQMYKAGLAFESHEPINWCPSCKTGLANEDLEDGKCERCGSVIEKKAIPQWVLRITDYAEQLLSGLEELDWPESIKESQRNWIGRSEGINITYTVEGQDEKVAVFTTRPDTNFGATFVVAAPDSAFVIRNLLRFPEKEGVLSYINDTKTKSDIDRVAEGRKKTGVATGWYALNQLNNKRLPIYVGDFVLGQVGTGIVVGVPGHDARDFEFAKAMDIEITRVVIGPDKDTSDITRPEQVQEKAGVMTNSDFLNGLDIHEATTRIMDYLEEKGWGKRVVNYKLRDWVFSRQRYWGEPIPLIHCEKCGVVPVPEKDLPVKLPNVESYEPTGTGESPLAKIEKWVNVKCPKCKGKAKRETNTMPQWAGSCWYHIAYCIRENSGQFSSLKSEKATRALKNWLPVDMYVGGAEHATRHLIYARFWHKFLYAIGVVSAPEPFQSLQNVGLIQATDGRKMSKRFGNVINPDDIVDRFGADSLRVYEMFMGPFNQAIAWNTDSLVGARRFLERIWKLRFKINDLRLKKDKDLPKSYNLNLNSLLHQTIKKVGEDIESFRFNTAVSSLMILLNTIEKDPTLTRTVFETFLKLLCPFAPHLAEELWMTLQKKRSIHLESWPEVDSSALMKEDVTIVVQVNGKLRGHFASVRGSTKDELVKRAQSLPEIEKWTNSKEVKKIIFVPDRLVNIVVG